MHRRLNPRCGRIAGFLALLLAGWLPTACDARGTPEVADAAEAVRTPLPAEAGTAFLGSLAPPGSQEGRGPTLDIARIGHDQGDPEAPIKVIEVTDFGCGYCRIFNQEIFPLLEQEFIQTGIIQWKFVPYVLGVFPHGDRAALAAECAAAQGGDAFLRMRNGLFAKQTGWRNSDEPDQVFAEIAQEEGLEIEAFRACLLNGDQSEQVELNVRLGKALGTQGTPAFVVEGVPVSGIIPVEGFRQIVQQLLAENDEPSRDWLPPPPTGGEPSLQSLVLDGNVGHGVGSPEAPVQIIEFSDFGCGYCRIFQSETRPVLDEEYVATGKVRWTYVPFVLGMFPNGDVAAVAGECAGEQDRFDVMRRRLYDEQEGWRGSSDPGPYFRTMAADEGLDGERFAACLDAENAPARIDANTRLGRSAGVRGTPTFFVNGFPVSGALPLDAFRDILDMELSALVQGGR